MEAPGTPITRLVNTIRSAGPLSIAVLVLGLAGGVLLIVTEFSTIVSIDVLTTGTCEELAPADARDACLTGGFEQHGGAFLLLGVVAIVMALGASRGASRPAAAALLAIGIVALGFIFARDIPKSNDTGLISLRYTEAQASPGLGLYLEVVGGMLCVGAGLLRLTERRDE
jgi:hypothetical protein